MTEQTLPKEWQRYLIEQRGAKIKQAKALEAQSRALLQEAATLAKMANIDNNAKEVV